MKEKSMSSHNNNLKSTLLNSRTRYFRKKAEDGSLTTDTNRNQSFSKKGLLNILNIELRCRQDVKEP